MLRLVLAGSLSSESEAKVGKDFFCTFMEAQEGFMGIGSDFQGCVGEVADAFWFRYQAKMRWPNLVGFEEAPATAM